MCLAFSLLPATGWLIIGFFVLFSSVKAEGGLRKFGRLLAIWTFIIAALFPIVGAYLTFAGSCPMEAVMEQMHAPAVT